MLFYGIITAIDLFTVVAYHDQRQKQVLSFYVKEVAKNTFFSFTDSSPKRRREVLPF